MQMKMQTKRPKIRKLSVDELTTGFVIVDISTATGGVAYKREQLSEKRINRGRGVRADLRTTKTVDNVEAVQALDKLVKEADYACRKHCAKTVFGWFATDEGLKALDVEFATLREKAATLNGLAESVGSKRRADIGFVPSRLNVADAETARAIARTIRETLTGVLEALRSGQVKGTGPSNELHRHLLKCKNLEQLAIGFAGEAVKAALERIPVAKREILDRLRNGEAPEHAGQAVDLVAIEGAIDWFKEGGISGTEDTRGAHAVAAALEVR